MRARWRTRKLLPVVLAVWVAFGCGDEQTSAPPVRPGSLRGTIRALPSGSLLPDALIVAGTASDTSDADGTYHIEGLAAGSIEVTARANGFVSQSRVVAIRSDETTTRDFALSLLPVTASGQITFVADDRLWRIEPRADATLEDLTVKLDAIARFPGVHAGPITVSTDGAWLVFRSERFDEEAAGWAALTIAPADLSSAEAVRTGGELLHNEGLAQAGDGGTFVVYVADGGPHTRDLWIVERAHPGWSAPRLLSGDSPFAWNDHPVLATDRVVFDAGDEPYGGDGTRVCAVHLDGTGFEVLVEPDDGPAGMEISRTVHSGALAPDGSVVFESEWGGVERVWRRRPGAAPSVIGSYANDNSPNVLPDGYVASLWLMAEGGEGKHHLKVMKEDGSSPIVLTIGAGISEVADVGIGVGPPIP